MGHHEGYRQMGWRGTVDIHTARIFSTHVHALFSHQTPLTNTSPKIKVVGIEGAQEGIKPNTGHF